MAETLDRSYGGHCAGTQIALALAGASAVAASDRQRGSARRGRGRTVRRRHHARRDGDARLSGCRGRPRAVGCAIHELRQPQRAVGRLVAHHPLVSPLPGDRRGRNGQPRPPPRLPEGRTQHRLPGPPGHEHQLGRELHHLLERAVGVLHGRGQLRGAHGRHLQDGRHHVVDLRQRHLQPRAHDHVLDQPRAGESRERCERTAPHRRAQRHDRPADHAQLGPLRDGRRDLGELHVHLERGGSTFQCSLDSTTAYTACSSPKDYSGLAAGSHTFRVRAIDAAGNVDATPASRTWTVQDTDTTPPDTAMASGPSGTVASSSASFTFTSTETGSTFQCSLDSGVYAGCSSPKPYSNLANGATPCSSAPWTRPATSTPRRRAGPGRWTPSRRIRRSGRVRPARSPRPRRTSRSPRARRDPPSSARSTRPPPTACSSPKDYSDLAPGSHTFRVRAVDPAGNVDVTPIPARGPSRRRHHGARHHDLLRPVGHIPVRRRGLRTGRLGAGRPSSAGLTAVRSPPAAPRPRSRWPTAATSSRCAQWTRQGTPTRARLPAPGGRTLCSRTATSRPRSPGGPPRAATTRCRLEVGLGTLSLVSGGRPVRRRVGSRPRDRQPRDERFAMADQLRRPARPTGSRARFAATRQARRSASECANGTPAQWSARPSSAWTPPHPGASSPPCSTPRSAAAASWSCTPTRRPRRSRVTASTRRPLAQRRIAGRGAGHPGGLGRPDAARRRRRGLLLVQRRRVRLAPPRHASRHDRHPRRHRAEPRLPGRVQRLLRPELGPPQGAHQAGRRRPRVRHPRRFRVLRLLRLGRGRPRQGLVQLRPRRLAHRRAEQQLRPRSAAAAQARSSTSGFSRTWRRTRDCSSPTGTTRAGAPARHTAH